MADYIKMVARYDTVCREKDCGEVIHKGEEFVYDTVEHCSYCLECGNMLMEENL